MTTIRNPAMAALAAAILAMTAPAHAFPGTVTAARDTGNAVHAVRDGGVSVDVGGGIGDALDTLDELGLLGNEDNEYDDDADAGECTWLHNKYHTTGKRYWLNRYRNCLRQSDED